MDLGLSAKTQAWIGVAMITLGAGMTAYQGAASDDWVSRTEWVFIGYTTLLTFLGCLRGAPKDAREPETKTRSTDAPPAN